MGQLFAKSPEQKDEGKDERKFNLLNEEIKQCMMHFFGDTNTKKL